MGMFYSDVTTYRCFKNRYSDVSETFQENAIKGLLDLKIQTLCLQLHYKHFSSEWLPDNEAAR